MRLTLRTLLAYLDDTLEPTEARQIGLKVAESEVARETIDRIKKVIRKRSITVPPLTGPDKADPNTVAEYLDSDLGDGKINEVEEQALNSDVHLAEIAACHQLLTLILSEPVTVPPTSKERMYNLVKGPEVDPTRKVSRVIPATIAADETEAEEWYGHPLVSRRGGNKRLALAGALAVLLALAAWMTMMPPAKVADPGPPGVLIAANHMPAPAEQPKEPPPEEKAAPAKAPDEKAGPAVVEKAAEKSKDMPKDVEPPPPAVDPAAAALMAARKTSDERKELGKLTTKYATLLQSVHDRANWERVATNGTVFGAAKLMSLPGAVNEVRLNDAVVMTLWGATPEFQVSIFESEATTFVPAAGFDADLRLNVGRVYLRAGKATGAKVRLRLGDDIFDLTFADDQAEVMAELVSGYNGEPFVKEAKDRKPPPAMGIVGVTRGKVKVQANLKVDAELAAAPGMAVWEWSAVNGPTEKPTELKEPVPQWAKTTNVVGPGRDLAMEMDALTKRLPRLLGTDAKKDIAVSVAEIAYDARSPLGLRLSLYCQAALDTLPVLLDALEDPANHESRQSAAFALHHWLGRPGDRDQKLIDALMSRKGYTAPEAEAAIALWHGYNEAGLRDPKTYMFVLDALTNDKLGVRELAYWRLGDLDAEGTRIIRYGPTDPAETRQRAFQEWKRRIPDGAVPNKPR